ncbi:hypothetical protein BGZ61DRAFT_483608 [Ilyonectria robusta]|uniref:uncharacterized protein n=1 Tax=Ilyonectria robusta TaxID=1079257 RepID=UPI001E8CDB96|nr:uncharacterized protein BGZ61DRAFT_483608 [Ilyonectria robusta]KAH8667690.1 hypothetical protein BGZ61DRAFT_483608 [Ilyonectria robusta]
MAGNRGLRARQVRRFEQHLRGTCPDHKCLVHLTPELLALADLLISHYGHGEQDEEKWLPSRSKTANAVSGTIRTFPQWAAEVEAAPQQDKRVVTTSQGIVNGPPEPGEAASPTPPQGVAPTMAQETAGEDGHDEIVHVTADPVDGIALSTSQAPAVPALSMGSVQLADAETGANKTGAVVRQTGPYPPGYLNLLALKTKAKRRGGQDD